MKLFALIDVWGFDEDAVKVLANMRPADENLIYKYAVLLGGKKLKPVRKDSEVARHLKFV